VGGRAYRARGVMAKMGIPHGKPRHVSREARVLCIPVLRYLGCVLSIRDRIKDRLLRQTRRELTHSRVPDQRKFMKPDRAEESRHAAQV